MQRFKAVETASSDGTWRVAQRMELIPEAVVTTVSARERAAAVRLELQETKLRNALQKPGDRARAAGAGGAG